MSNALRRKSGALVAIALMGGLAFAIYVFSQDKELAVDLFKALFGLSGGITVGG
jgi:hypothetical protein